MAAHPEVETAFEVPAAAALPDLSGLPGVARVDGSSSVRLVATYWDTPALDLTRAGVSLRHRTGGDDAGWHLKLPSRAGGAGRRRTEHRVRAEATTPPAELLALVRARVRDQDVGPVVTLETDRSTARLLGADGGVLAEVADDVVVTHRGGGAADDEARPADDGDVARTWREWEVELVTGDDDLLTTVGEAVVGAGGTPRGASKVQRALGDRVPVAPATTPADGTAAEVLRAYLARHVERLLVADAGVREGDDDAVHDARVATRRVRTALRVLRPVVDRAVSEPVRARLQHAGRVLGAARDAAVERDAFAARLAAEPVELVLGPVARRLADDREAARAAAMADVVTLLDDPAYLAVLGTLDAWTTALPRGPRADEPASTVVPRRVRKAWRRVDVRARALADAGDGQRDDALHDLRRAARRARYASEVAREVVGRPARRSARRARAVQDVLGRQHDGVVRRATLRRVAVQAHLDGENAFTYGRLHAAEQQDAERAEADAAPALRRALARGHRAWMS